MAVLLKLSSAVTVKLNGVPAVAFAGALTRKCVAGAALTLMLLLVPATELFAVSVALIALLPAMPVAAIAVSLFRYVTASDEFMQRLHLQALAIAAGVVAVGSIAVGFLAAAKVVSLDGSVLLLVFPALMLVYGPVLAWAKRRYRD